ncbi:MmgE/PrpD family protein [Nocardia jinanensis]|uniref:MmgE/Prp family protein n=1 Tax=Nocardia jinanensis TaxID=382504 RepID=A0A917R6G5_9NOCA|nr:MmgE/PrpD family protein [Nocardia jinanensis]GGK91648.1 MmgE/Prp family protein [Nocardia jinanensis]
MTTADVLGRACETVSALELDRVPPESIEKALRIIADCFAVSVAGHRTEPMSALVAADTKGGLVTGGTERNPFHRSTVWGGGRAPAHHAAFLNATAGSFLELDEGMRPTGHPGMQLVPAAIAVAEEVHASGTELLRAVIAGYELSARLFRAVRLRPGAHPHGHVGALGAALAVSMVRGTDIRAATAIASTLPLASTWQACYDGATARNAYMGHAAAVGVRSSDLARAGFTGSFASFGFSLGELLGEGLDETALADELRYEKLAIDAGYFKVHSACALTHTAIDAALDLLESEPLAPDAITSVRIDTVAAVRKVDIEEVPNDLSCRFSISYAVAAALATGTSGPEAFRFRPDIAALARRVEVHVDPQLEERWPVSSPARVRVEVDGRVLESLVENPTGHPPRVLSREVHFEKFAAAISDPDRARDAWARIMDLPRLDDAGSLLGW